MTYPTASNVRALSSWIACCVAISGVALGASKKNTDKDLVFDESRPLLTLRTTPVRQYALTDLDKLLHLAAQGEAAATPRPVVIYVHGRGNEPRKSFTDTFVGKGELMQKVEAYGVGAIGFNWDSKIRPMHFCDRPVDKAAAAAPAFAQLVADLQDHKVKHPDFWARRQLILLVHSMGSYVLVNAASAPALPKTPVFDRIVVTSSDAPAEKHGEWLLTAAWRGSTPYVLVNPEDKILKKSQKCEAKALKKAKASQTASERLGRMTLSPATAGLSSSANYYQVPVKKRHRYFTKGGQYSNSNVCRLMSGALVGGDNGFASGWLVPGTTNQYQVPSIKDPKNACYGNVAPESDGDD